MMGGLTTEKRPRNFVHTEHVAHRKGTCRGLLRYPRNLIGLGLTAVSVRGFNASVRPSFQLTSRVQRRCVARTPEGDLDDLMGEVGSLLTDLQGSSQGWRFIDWKHAPLPKHSFPVESFSLAKKEELRPTVCPDRPSPVETVMIRDRLVYIKRDDLLRLDGSNLSGNKARKMFSLNALPAADFPKCVVSYGGPQSNAMLALAAIVHAKNFEMLNATVETPIEDEMNELFVSDEPQITTNIATPQVPKQNSTVVGSVSPRRFVYYTKTLPRFLRNQPNGNLFRAKLLGMEIVELSHEEYNNLFASQSGGRPEPPSGIDPPVPGDSLWVPQGGACDVAVAGGCLLATEIFSFWSAHGNGRPLSICVPGGTCTTALLLHQELKRLLSGLEREDRMDIEVIVIPCVGDDAYARRQMMALNRGTGGRSKPDDIPTVLTPAPENEYFSQAQNQQRKYFTFGEPHAELLETVREMETYGVTLDLLYGAPSFTLLLRHWRTKMKEDSAVVDENNPLTGREIMYVHSGGLEGINSQMTRYKYKGLVDLEDIQYPSRQSE